MNRVRRLPRPLHPVAWWVWALGLAVAASRTTNPLLTGLVIAVAAVVVARRRPEAPWAAGFRMFLVLGLTVVAVRVVLRALFDGSADGDVWFRLPELPLPDAAAGIRIGGAVTAQGVLAAVYDGLRLAALIVCFGAASSLADPKRLLKHLPGALYELGVAATVAVTVAPQVVVSAARVRRAQRLRGTTTRRRHGLRALVFPVLEDALERSVALAAAMDARGYGRRAAVGPPSRRATAACTLAGLAGVCVGTYGTLDATAPRALGLPVLAAGAALATAGLVLAGRRVRRSTYRPEPWRAPEWGVVACGAVAAVVLVASGVTDALHPPLQPLTWPSLPPGPTLALVAAAAAGWIAPPPEPRPADDAPLAAARPGHAGEVAVA
ncbi:MAG: cobalt ABC transporter permease [Acidimicrobiia bacterium]|nr:MAG: cobalt ABC transporter permease [Acidimicrobiia bacterium]